MVTVRDRHELIAWVISEGSFDGFILDDPAIFCIYYTICSAVDIKVKVVANLMGTVYANTLFLNQVAMRLERVIFVRGEKMCLTVVGLARHFDFDIDSAILIEDPVERK